MKVWFRLDMGDGRSLWFSWRQLVTLIHAVQALRSLNRDFGVHLEVRKGG